MKEVNVGLMKTDSELIEQAAYRVNMLIEKNKKIHKMSSLQRTRHQYQFAVLHFLLNGMDEFIDNTSMESNQKKGIIIVYEHKTSRAANYLAELIKEIEKSGIEFEVNLCSSYEYKKLLKKGQKSNEKYIIYIGNFFESKKACDSIQHWCFNNFGFRYGRTGYIAVITFNRKPSKDEFGQMVNIAETEFLKMKHQIDMLARLKENPWKWNELSTTQKVLLVGGTVVAATLLGAGTGAFLNNKERKEDAEELINTGKDSPDPKYLPPITQNFLSKEQIEELEHKTKMEDFTDEEWDYINNISEYAEEWIGRDDELWDMSLEDYHDMRCLDDYGLDNEFMDCGDEESVVRND